MFKIIVAGLHVLFLLFSGCDLLSLTNWLSYVPIIVNWDNLIIHNSAPILTKLRLNLSTFNTAVKWSYAVCGCRGAVMYSWYSHWWVGWWYLLVIAGRQGGKYGDFIERHGVRCGGDAAILSTISTQHTTCHPQQCQQSTRTTITSHKLGL